MSPAPWVVHYALHRLGLSLGVRPRTLELRAVMADSDGGVEDLEKTVSKARSGINDGREMNAGSQSESDSLSKSEYCEKLQEWMWQYYCGYVSWHSWLSVFPGCLPTHAASPSLRAAVWGPDMMNTDPRAWVAPSAALPFPAFPSFPTQAEAERQVEITQRQNAHVPQHLQHNGHAQQPGREYFIPSPLHRFLAEMVDFFILFFIKATIILSIMHLSGMKDISKFAMHFIVEEIDEDTSMEELQKMMLVALVYRILVCFYEIICIWGVGGATPGKFLLGLRVVTCDTSVLVQPNRVRVVPATNVSLSASTIRALNKNFSIAFFFPAFITLLFFQHNRTVYDIVAGTIVVKRNRHR